jgi:hypothetical protein
MEELVNRNTGRGMVDNRKALDMLDAFASVGVRAFDVTMTDIKGDKIPRGFQANRGVDQLRASIGPQLERATRARENFIIRPRSTTATLIQLDDLPAEAAAAIGRHAFMVLCTSPGNFQAWVAVKDAPPDFARRLRKGAGADPSASGATRISGSLNFKTKYAPAFPTVEITHAPPARSRPPPSWPAPDLSHRQRKPPAVFLIVFLRPAGQGRPGGGRAMRYASRTPRRCTKASARTSAGRISHGA